MANKSWIQLFTDGSCIGNPGPGAWGFIANYPDGSTHQVAEAEDKTTSNRMELTAVIRGISFIAPRALITIYTDSQYVQQGITHWIKRWQVNGWRSSKGRTVANVDLWKLLVEAEDLHDRVIYNWIPGHDTSFPTHHEIDRTVYDLAQRRNQILINSGNHDGT